MGALLQEKRPEETHEPVLSDEVKHIETRIMPLHQPEHQQSSNDNDVAMPTPILYFSYFFFAAAFIALLIGLWMETSGN